MTADEAVALALGRKSPARVERVQRPGGITGREVQIVLDIARGLTNRQIAERLGISELTGELCIRPPQGVLRVSAGRTEPGTGADIPVQISSCGSTDLRELIMFVVDATRPFSSPATFP
jgi:Bacterial regulatory proteins, luxR family